MKIAIIGAGAIGSAIARNFARSGIHAFIANSREPETLKALTNELGPWNGRILVDANNAVRVELDANHIPSFHAVDLGGLASSEVVAQWAPSARVVKAFNHLIAQPLASGPVTEGGRRVLFLAGQDADAKKIISDLIVRLGFSAVDLGGVNESRLTQFPGGALSIINLAHINQ